jgi:NAD(P)-dependent dehydrogenase (short-subunit alcohol dehydrogenase family)
MRLRDQVAIVTGGAGGIGAGICHAFAEEGADIAIVDIKEPEMGSALATKIEKTYGRAASFIKTDVTSISEVRAMVSEVADRWGKIDILVNNAGISTVSRIEHMSEEEWDHVFQVNLKGHFLCSQAVIPFLKQQKHGRIINMGSLNAKNGGVITGGAYASSKGAVHSFTFALAKELSPYGINVNAVAPGPIDTDMIRAYPEEKVRSMLAHIPLKRLGSVDEVAKTIVFLASQDAGYITGEVIDINGGSWTD